MIWFVDGVVRLSRIHQPELLQNAQRFTIIRLINILRLGAGVRGLGGSPAPAAAAAPAAATRAPAVVVLEPATSAAVVHVRPIPSPAHHSPIVVHVVRDRVAAHSSAAVLAAGPCYTCSVFSILLCLLPWPFDGAQILLLRRATWAAYVSQTVRHVRAITSRVWCCDRWSRMWGPLVVTSPMVLHHLVLH